MQTILVVDDEPALCRMLTRKLSLDGYTVHCASDGQTALDKVAVARPELVLLDVHMPGLSGLEVVRRLRARYTSFELPVMMLSGDVDGDTVMDALEAGANDYIAKPFDVSVLRAKVKVQMRRIATESERTAIATQKAPQFVALRSSLGTRRAPLSGPEGAGSHRRRRELTESGVMLSNRYEIEDLIGSGAFGDVFAGRHVQLERPVAIKIMHANVARRADDIADFQREGVIACRLNHPNAVQMLDCGVSSVGVPYLVMELLVGRTLADELAAVGSLSVDRCAVVVRQICACLAAAHAEGIVHHDLKPANVYLHQAFGLEVLKVVDFGTAELMHGLIDAASSSRPVVGSPAYMAPERFTGARASPAADIYSLGCMMYEMLSGRLPFPGGTSLAELAVDHMDVEPPALAAVSTGVPDSIAALVHQCLVKSAKDRPIAADVAARFAAAAATAAEANAV